VFSLPFYPVGIPRLSGGDEKKDQKKRIHLPMERATLTQLKASGHMQKKDW